MRSAPLSGKPVTALTQRAPALDPVEAPLI